MLFPCQKRKNVMSACLECLRPVKRGTGLTTYTSAFTATTNVIKILPSVALPVLILASFISNELSS